MPRRPMLAALAAGILALAGGGRTLMPGLIDNHVHIALSTTSRAELVDPKFTPELLQARATEEAKQTLLRGFTSVRDMGGPVLAGRAAIARGDPFRTLGRA